MNKYTFEPQKYTQEITAILGEIMGASKWNKNSLHKILTRFPRDGNSLFSRDQLLQGLESIEKHTDQVYSQEIREKIKMKPTRTISGVTPVTVLTKPFPCPGECIFCPNDVKMPKSYLSNEPGAQRAESNKFDPYLQTYNRLQAFKNIGHNIEKVELIVLGGTWSFYPKEYKIWFIKRCFDAMNDFGSHDERANIKTENIFTNEVSIDPSLRTYNQSINNIVSKHHSTLIGQFEKSSWDELFESHKINTNAKCRNVGLVIETRPDYITPKEIVNLRKLGATKIQIGIQSLNDDILAANKRGHNSKQTADAIKLLRMGGFKIHAHWMPNLYGSTVKDDIKDYNKLWLKEFEPDELKIYPTSIIENTPLNDLYNKGMYKPYTYTELLEVLTATIPITPRYCRLTRIIRDIPSTDIVAGNKLTNFRQIAELNIQKQGSKCQCIRCREIKSKNIIMSDVELEILSYETSVSTEYFISFKTIKDDFIVGFLRLMIPLVELSHNHFIEELQNKAIIREVHIYGQVVGIGDQKIGKSQHLGLGSLLISKAKEIARENHFDNISVISAIGTQNYYSKKGFTISGLYMTSHT